MTIPMRSLCYLLAGASCLSAASISVQPGSGPAGGYLPLNIFSVPALGGFGNDTSVVVNLPGFNYGGAMFTTIAISSNGYITLGDNASSAVNQNFPDPAAPNGILAPFWTDLNPLLGGGIHVATLTDGVTDWDVIDWESVRNASDANTNSFEIWLQTGGIEGITFSYGSISAGSGGLLTVGAESLNGTSGVVGATRYFNGTGIAPLSNTELTVTTSGSPNFVPEPGTAGLLTAGFFGVIFGIRRQRYSRR